MSFVDSRGFGECARTGTEREGDMTMSVATIDLRTPAGTRDGLRAQASVLDIRGRGSMNKAQLIEAIHAELTRRAAQSLVDGTDDVVKVTPHADGTTTVTVPVKTEAEASARIRRVEAANRVMDRIEAEASKATSTTVLTVPELKPYRSARELRVGRTGRVDYPARQRAGKGRSKGGRK